MPEEPLIGMVGGPEGAEVVEAIVNELLEGCVGNPDAAVDTVDVPELPITPEDELVEGVGDTDELTEGAEVMLTLGSNVGLTVLFLEIEMLPVGLLVKLTPDVELVVTFGNPLIKWALMVLVSGKGCWLLSLSLKKQFGWSRLSGK